MLLNKLRAILTESNENYLFPCINELVLKGICLERFTKDEKTPSRQEITQYLVAWFKYIGLSPDECREWMIEYCVDILSDISSSSKSQIRHSTKSNIKYIYGSDVTFDCRCENNRFKAACESKCPIYEEMLENAKKAKIASAIKENESRVKYKADSVMPILKPSFKKDEYKEQFEKAMVFIEDHIKRQVPKKKIVILLNEQGFKTRTGMKWSASILGNEMRARKK